MPRSRYPLFTNLMLVALGGLLLGCDNTTPEQHLSSAQVSYGNGELRTAVIELKNALQKNSLLVEARVLLGETYLKMGDYPSALKEFERALDLGDQSDRVLIGLQRSKLGLGRDQEVIGYLEELADRSVALDLLLADAYLNGGNLIAAEPLYRLGEDRSAGQSGLAAIAWRRGDLVTATRLFNASVEGSVEGFLPWLRKAEFELAQNRLDEAKASFAKVSESPAGEVSGRMGIVRTLLAEDDVESAGEAINDVLAIAPDYPLARYLEGLIRYQLEDFEAADEALLQVQRRYPDHQPTLYLMGLVRYRLGQLAQAEYNVTRFLAFQPGNESARKLLAIVSLEQGKLDEAITALQPVAATTGDAQLLAMLGKALTQDGRAAEANEVLTRAVELDPEGAAFRNQLALSLLSAGEKELARSELEAAVRVDGDQIQSEVLMAMLSIRDGKTAEGRELINVVVEKSPENPIGPNLLGVAALADKDFDAAAAHFRRALELDPSFIAARRNLARLLEKDKDFAAAEELFRSRVTAAPDDLAAQIALTNLLVRSDKIDAALESARDAVAKDSSSLLAQLGLARVYQLRGQAPQAEETIDAALAQEPDNTRLKVIKAELALARGDTGAARSHVNDLQALFINANQPNPQFALLLGRLQTQLDNIVVARSNFETAVEGFGDDNAEALLALGRLNLAEGEFAAVKRQLRELAGANDEAVQWQRDLLAADLAMAQDDIATAKRLYESLRREGNREATLRLAQIALSEGRSAVGIALLEKQVNQNPEDQRARLMLSGALLSNNRKADAIVQYEKLLATGNPVVLNNLAWLYMEQGDKRALEVGAEAYKNARDNPDVSDTYGWILVQMGNVEEGIRVLRESLSQRGNNPTVLYHLGAAQAKAGRSAQARRQLRRALAGGSFPERGDAEALLATLSDS